MQYQAHHAQCADGLDHYGRHTALRLRQIARMSARLHADLIKLQAVTTDKKRRGAHIPQALPQFNAQAQLTVYTQQRHASRA